MAIDKTKIAKINKTYIPSRLMAGEVKKNKPKGQKVSLFPNNEQKKIKINKK